MDPLLIGSIVAVLRWQGWLGRLPLRRIAASCACVLISLEVLSILIKLDFKSLGGFEYLHMAFYYPGISMLFAALLVHCLRAPNSFYSGLLSEPWICQLGRWSYGIYLTHNSINHGIQKLGLSYGLFGSNLLGQALQYFFTMSLAICAGATCYYLIERPFLDLRRFLPGEAHRTASSSISPASEVLKAPQL